MEENKKPSKLSDEELASVSGGMVDSMPGMHYDVTLGRWVPDEVETVTAPGAVVPKGYTVGISRP